MAAGGRESETRQRLKPGAAKEGVAPGTRGQRTGRKNMRRNKEEEDNWYA
jgi:hypothetical protein